MREFFLRSVTSNKSSVKLIFVKPEKGNCSCRWKTLSISACPEWLENKCDECGNNASSTFFSNKLPTLVEIDGVFKVLCDECRNELLKENNCKHIIIQEKTSISSIASTVQIEWSVNNESWYPIAKANIVPSSAFMSKEERDKRLNDLFVKLEKNEIVKVKGDYDKLNKKLLVDLNSF